jgi:hypothetical protein
MSAVGSQSGRSDDVPQTAGLDPNLSKENFAIYRSRSYTDYRANIASEGLHIFRNSPIHSGTGPNPSRKPLGLKVSKVANQLEFITAGQ